MTSAEKKKKTFRHVKRAEKGVLRYAEKCCVYTRPEKKKFLVHKRVKKFHPQLDLNSKETDRVTSLVSDLL